ncbi:hypothetical protein ADK92_12995 [Streptomyces sp. XY533]|nr:hypothetical protein ADK92_12995 [Streptomyces sp. XY533]
MPDPARLPANTGPAGASPFDALRRLRPDGAEFWHARDLQPLMGYSQWSKLKTPLERAMAAARNTGLDVDENFARSGKVSGSRGPAQEDYALSRLGAYLTAMNGDPNKPEVAAAQAYFAVRTREAETAPAIVPLDPATPEGALALARQYVRVAEQLVHADRRVRELEPKAAVHDRFLSADGGDRLVRQAAKEMGWRESQLRGFLIAERLIYQRQRPCGGVEYDFYAGPGDHFATAETLVRHRNRPGQCAHYTLYIRPAGLALIQARVDKRRLGR